MFDIQLLEHDILTSICHSFKIKRLTPMNDKLLFYPSSEGDKATKTYLKNIYNIFKLIEMEDSFERFLDGETKYNPINNTNISCITNGSNYEFHHILSYLHEEKNFIEKFIHHLGINEKEFKFVFRYDKNLSFHLETVHNPSKEDIDNLWNFLNFYSRKTLINGNGTITYYFIVEEIFFKITISRSSHLSVINKRKEFKE